MYSTARSLIACGLVAATVSFPVGATDVGNMMNPGKWMSPGKWFGNQNRDEERYYGNVPPGYGYGGPGYGYGAGAPVQQQQPAPPPQIQ